MLHNSIVIGLVVILITMQNIDAEIRLSSCPRICTTQYGHASDPVCGTDGIIYPSYCEMRKKTCGLNVNISPDKLLCFRSTGSKCEHKCGTESDYVCGTDGHTYPNRCILEVERCRLGDTIRLAHYGSCNNISAHRENCPVDCKKAPVDGPICGSDGNVYKSSCLMKLYTCGQGVVKANKRLCQTTRHCREACFRSSKSVCGSDGKIYANSCKMKAKNCGKHVFEIPMSFCLVEERNSNSVLNEDGICPTKCPEKEVNNGTLICGSDLQIYRSTCEMQMINCGLHSWKQVKKVDSEKCRKRLYKCSKIQCDNKEAQPVCGSDAITYPSQCHLDIATCLRGIKLAHLGNCTNFNEDVCPKQCKDRTVSVVCGSDGNVYRSICHMKRDTCGQNVVPVALKFCRTTEACEDQCSDEKNHVCGSDNQIYKNECIMKQKNCGRHVFVMPMKQCLSRFRFQNCTRFCTEIFDPVCASDNRTYSNMCHLNNAKCEFPELSLQYYGTCTQPEQTVRNFVF